MQMTMGEREAQVLRRLEYGVAAPLKERETKPNGSLAALILGLAVGAAIYSLIALIARFSVPFDHFLVWNKSVGSLSGKTAIGLFGWITTWYLLYYRWSGEDVDMRRVWVWTIVFSALAFVFSYPPLFQRIISYF